MTTIVKCYLPQLSQVTGFTLWLRKCSDFSLVNAGGDTLSESGTSGWFTATVAETWTETLSATILDSSGLCPASGILGIGSDTLAEVMAESGVTAAATLSARTLPAADYATSTALTNLRTFLRKLFQLITRKDAAIQTDNAAELAEINASGGSGAGAFNNTTDSLQELRHHGDIAWGSAASEPQMMLQTTIASVTSQTVFVLTTGSPDNNAYLNCTAIITDAVTSNQKAKVTVSGYVASTKTLTIEAAAVFIVAAGDSVALIVTPVSEFSGSALTRMQVFFMNIIASIQTSQEDIVGFPAQLIQGDDYISLLSKAIRVLSLDSGGNRVYGKGTLLFRDATITGALARLGNNNEIRMTVTFFENIGSDPYWLIEIPQTETRKAIPNQSYFGQMQHVWLSPSPARHTFGGIETRFIRDVEV
jgi:hypothetical protein